LRLSIRARLTGWYLVLLGATLVGVAAFVLVRLRTDLRADIDHTTASSAFQIAQGYAKEGPSDFYDVSATVLPGSARGPVAAQVLDGDGVVVLHWGDRVALRPLIAAQDEREILRVGSGYRSIRAGQRSELFRVYARRVTVHGRAQLILVAASLRAIDDSVQRLLVLLLFAFALALIVAAASGWWLARKALRPVATMTRRARELGVHSLDQRLQLPRTRDELWDLAATLNSMFDSIQGAVGAQKRLVADTSHELRTPLAVMRSSVDVRLMDPDLDRGTRVVLEAVRDELLRLSRLVEDLLMLARFDEHGIELQREPVALRAVVERVVVELDGLAAERGVEIQVSGPPAGVDGDRQKLAQAVVNLVDNAIRHSPIGATVTIETWQRDGRSGVTVTDSGAGIPRESAAQVFDRFFRVDPAPSGNGRGGLGLAIAREIVSAHGGTIWLDPGRASGSSFSFALASAPVPTPQIRARHADALS
jgi:heavy metal sensor kinase